MATYGQYEAVRELSRSGLAAVWAARRAGSADEPVFAIKLCEPDPDVTGADAAAQAVEGFLDQVQVQRRAAASGSHWAPVHDSGMVESGAYLVTDLYPRSAERLTLSRVRPDAATLHNVVGSIVAGLRELRASASRQHGNLRASNILVGPGAWASAKVVLSDPLPTRGVKGLKPEADTRALGELIYELVMHQPFRGAYTVADSPEWTGLGRARQGWLDLCNRLLDATRAPPSLDEIDAALSGLATAGGPRRLPMVLGVAAAALVLVGVVVAYFAMRGSGGGEVHHPDLARWAAEGEARWQQLCDEWPWFMAFAGRLEDKPGPAPLAAKFPTRRALYATDPVLKAGLDALAQAEKDNGGSPGVIDGRTRVPISTLKRDPSPQAQSPRSMDRTRALLEAMGRFRPPAEGRWERAEMMRAHAESASRRGWSVLERKLRAAADGALEAVDWSERADRLDAAFAALDAAEAAEARWTEIDRVASALEGTGDSVLARFREWAQGAGSDPELADLDAAAAWRRAEQLLAERAQVGRDLESARQEKWSGLDPDVFKESPSHARADAPARRDLFEAWILDARSGRYDRPPAEANPSVKWASSPPLAGPARQIALLAEDRRADPGDTELSSRLSGFEQVLKRLSDEAGAVDSLPWSARGREEKERRAGEVERSAASLRDELAAYIEARRRSQVAGIEEARAKIRSDPSPVPGSAAIGAAWERWRDPLNAELERSPYRAVMRRQTAAHSTLTRVNKEFPSPPASLGPRRDWTTRLVEIAARERDRVLGEALSAIAEPPEADGEEALIRSLDSAAAGYRAWTAEAEELASGFARVEDLLDLGFGLDEPAPQPPMLGRLVESLEAQRVYADRAVQGALVPVTARVEELRRIKGLARVEDVYAALRRALDEDPGRHPEAAISAWRRLAEFGWPADLDQLKAEKQIAERLRPVVGAMRDDERRSRLSSEIETTAGARWAGFVLSRRGAAEVEAALEQRPTTLILGRPFGDADEPRLAYMWAVFQLKRFLAPVEGQAPSDEQVRARAAEMMGTLDEVLSRGPSLAGDGRVRTLREALDAIRSGVEPPAPKIDVLRLGPGSVGWTGLRLGDGDDRLRFTPPGAGGTALDFVLVEATDGVPEPVFLSTVEVPVGVLLWLAQSREHRGALESLLPSAARLRGPMTWTRAGDRIELSSTWLDPMASRELPKYTEPRVAEVVRAVQEAGRPTATHPVQQVSAAAALWVSRVLGCRIPTPAEWRAAVRAAAPGEPNLRDQSWAQRHAVVRALDDALTNDVRKGIWMPWPDRGVFTPAGSVIAEGRAAVAGPRDDGRVWFAPADAGGSGSFTHLVGNVAEFVLDAAEDAEALPTSPADGVRRFIESHAARLGIIGGSALGDPTLPTDQPLSPPPDDAADLIGYADVGFRLAFSAKGLAPKRKTFAARLLEALGEDPYLAAR